MGIHEKRVTVFESDLIPDVTFGTYEVAESAEINRAIKIALGVSTSAYIHAIGRADSKSAPCDRRVVDELRAVLRFLADKANAAATQEWLAEHKAKTEAQAAE
jgi:hypothetical protein